VEISSFLPSKIVLKLMIVSLYLIARKQQRKIRKRKNEAKTKMNKKTGINEQEKE
jgi:preprotein translocase subunit YajC